jgi:hypothetical protein
MECERILAEMAKPFPRFLDPVLVEFDEFSVPDPGILAACNQSSVTFGHLIAVILVGVDSLQKSIRTFYVSSASDPLQLAQGRGDVGAVLKDVTCDDEIERVVTKRHVFDHAEDDGAVRNERLVVSFAGNLVGIEKNIRAWKRISTRPNFQDEILGIDRDVKAPQGPGEVIATQPAKESHRKRIPRNETRAKCRPKSHLSLSFQVLPLAA